MGDKVFVTGIGVISALGVGATATLDSLMNGETGIGKLRHLTTEHDYLPVGEVKLSNAEMAQILNLGYPYDELRTVLMGIIAAKEAIVSAELDEQVLSKCAFINGTTVGGMDKTEKHFKEVFDANAETPDSVELKYNDCGCSSELIADQLGKVKTVTTTSTACSSAANAIILGANMIKTGLVDIAIVGGSESLTKFHLNGFNTLMILDKEKCRPFDRDRAGINLGEGAAYLVIESEKSMTRRGIRPLALLSGYANTCDAFHQTATSENGEGAFLSMRKAMDMARLFPSDIDYINAHGTGTPNNDVCEFAAMERIWGYELPPFSSTKSFTGHTTSASGSIESVICILSILNNFIPRNIGFVNPMKDSAIPVTENLTDHEVSNVICNSFGFGGNDSTLIFSKANGYE